MKQIINLLAICLILSNAGFAQSTKPVKKIVTSKISKDPKTGKIVKTVTTTTVTDIVLNPGSQPKTVAKAQANKPKAVVITKKPARTIKSSPAKVIAKAPVVKPKAVIVQKKPVVVPKDEQKFVEKTEVSKTEEPSQSIFTNPTDQSATNEVKNSVNKPAASKGVTKTPTKIFKEGKRPKDLSDARTYLGVRGGLNLANVENARSLTQIAIPTVNNLNGVMGGVFINIGFSKSFSLQPEINYSSQGYSITDGMSTETLNNKAVNVPVLMKFALGKSNLKFFVNAGPYAGILLNSKKTNNINGLVVENLIDFATDKNKEISTNRFDYGLQGGAGIQINLGGPKLELEGRYQYGLADPLIYASKKPSYIGETGRNRIITGTIGLLFPIK